MSKQQTKKPQAGGAKGTKAVSMKEINPSKSRFLPVYWLLLAIAILVYGNSIFNNYALDDAMVITDNAYTQKGVSGIKEILTADTFFGFFKENTNNVAGGRYRPFSLITFAFEYQFFGLSPHFSHFINILLFGFCGIGIFIFIKKILQSTQLKYLENSIIPLLTSVLFLVHPIHTEAVANIKGRDEIFSLLFSIFTVIYLMKYIDKGRQAKHLIIGFLLFFFALLSKENSFTFIIIIPLTFYFFRKINLKDYAIILSPTAVASALFFFLRHKYAAGNISQEITEILNNPFAGSTAVQRYATIVFTIGKYFLLLIFPHPLTHDYYYNQVPLKSFSDIGVILSGILIIGLAIIAIIQLQKKTIVSYSIIFFAVTFVLVSNIFFPVGTTMSERFVFMPSLGFCFIFAYYINKIPAPVKTVLSRNNNAIIRDRSVIDNKISLGLIVVVLGFYSIKTIARNPAWKDNLTLFTTDVQTSTNSAKLNNAAGGELIHSVDSCKNEKDKLDTINMAKPYLMKALEIYSKYTNAWLLLGNTHLLGDKKYDSALTCYVRCLEIQPNYRDAFNNMKVLFNKSKDYKLQATFYAGLSKMFPENSEIPYEAAQGYTKANNPDSSIYFLRKAISLKSNYDAAYELMGMIYGHQKQELDSSLYYLNIAIQYNPKNWEAYENMGVAYGMQKKYDSAVAILEKGMQLNPGYAKFYLNLGITYQIEGMNDKANGYFQKAFQMDPTLRR